MAATLIVLALLVASALGVAIPAAKYPADVSPHACPNYPYCDNVALAAYSSGHHHIAPYAAPSYAAYGHYGAAGVHGVAAKYPAGVDPHICPNYPYCDNVALAAHRANGAYGAVPVWGYGVVAAHHGAGARYPAGINPHDCPNYPYCH
ncbi:cuticle protein 1-like [Hetaerina americana]|uniref:cuticle protein 1-like n=1 Tax=Hetaerina americana TaxID=62018 RepID=UPI003A7F62B7